MEVYSEDVFDESAWILVGLEIIIMGENLILYYYYYYYFFFFFFFYYYYYYY